MRATKTSGDPWRAVCGLVYVGGFLAGDVVSMDAATSMVATNRRVFFRQRWTSLGIGYGHRWDFPGGRRRRRRRRTSLEGWKTTSMDSGTSWDSRRRTFLLKRKKTEKKT